MHFLKWLECWKSSWGSALQKRECREGLLSGMGTSIARWLQGLYGTPGSASLRSELCCSVSSGHIISMPPNSFPHGESKTLENSVSKLGKSQGVCAVAILSHVTMRNGYTTETITIALHWWNWEHAGIGHSQHAWNPTIKVKRRNMDFIVRPC